MTVPTFALVIDQGDDETVDIAVKEADGGPQDLTGCTLYFSIATSAGAPTNVLEKQSPASITITNEEGGLAEVPILGSETALLDNSLTGRLLRAEVQVKDGADKITTLARGTLLINRDLAPSP